jgi:hypothetical protein
LILQSFQTNTIVPIFISGQIAIDRTADFWTIYRFILLKWASCILYRSVVVQLAIADANGELPYIEIMIAGIIVHPYSLRT